MEPRQIPPLLVALSILVVFVLILATILLDSRIFAVAPFEPDAARSVADYDDLYVKARYEYALWALEERRLHFDWNLRSTKYIFWVSMVVSISGVCFSFWQFAQAAQFDRLQREVEEVAFKSQMASLSFRTRSVASLVLLVSIIYLMIYVAFLYPIRNVPDRAFEDRAETGETAETTSGASPGGVIDLEAPSGGLLWDPLGAPVPDRAQNVPEEEGG